jgi:signal-transduction protein with cAMP-binding, CBS, and nucleotidyltransferase domain
MRGMKPSDRHNLSLARVPLFTGLDDATRDDILSCIHSRRYAAGELICRQGDPSDSLFLLRSGVAQAFLTSLTGSSSTTIARLRPGDVIGEVGVVTNLPRSASVLARSDAVVLELVTSRKSSVDDSQRRMPICAATVPARSWPWSWGRGSPGR